MIEIVELTFPIFVLAFANDWTQCCASGIIKGAGFQGIGSLCSLLCLCLIALPAEAMLAFRLDWDIKGLWIGYGASASMLTILYYIILACIDWRKTAEWAAQNED